MTPDATPRQLARIYGRAHDLMRNTDGLQPQEAFDELLKYLLFNEVADERDETVPLQFELKADGAFGVVSNGAAKRIRAQFRKYASEHGSASSHLWRDPGFRLSDAALLSIHEAFQGVDLKSMPFDKRSAALREFVPPEIRKGLGMYLTPDEVVRMAVEILEPKVGSKVFDPACGSGTFLIETLRYWRKVTARRRQSEVWGTDKNPRMLLLSELNIGHAPDVTFHGTVADSLFEPERLREIGIRPNGVDYIFTNPPFGVLLDSSVVNLEPFETCSGASPSRRQQSEVVFIEQCLKLLKPGGWLAIVLPKSVITNASLDGARKAIDRLGHVAGVVVLPPETFAATGTQTTTVVAFIRKFHADSSREDATRIAVARVVNVGFDATGRVRAGGQLAEVAQSMQSALKTGISSGSVELVGPIPVGQTMEHLGSILSGQGARPTRKGLKLGDVLAIARTGRTPARSAYADRGLFLVKVGNLTGNGISWMPRDRNFITAAELEKREASDLLLANGDVLLTSSAHSLVYIAKKVDIVTRIPAEVGGAASFVGEVMMLRAKQGAIDPYALLAYLRSTEAQEAIQKMVRGQTAHLHADDVLDLWLPEHLKGTHGPYRKVAALLREEARLNDELNSLAFRVEEQLHALTS